MSADASDRPADLLGFDPEMELHIREQAKRSLRAKMRALRASVPADMRAQRSAAIVDQLRALPELERAEVVLTFLPIKGEPDLRPLHAELLAAGVRLALTRVDLDSGTLHLHAYQRDKDLVPGPFGLLEPSANAPLVADTDVDLVLTPGLVMDVRGHRIGYGQGHFDRLLVKLPKAFFCGVCFDFQLVGEAPNLPHDVPLHAVVTDARSVYPDSPKNPPQSRP